MFTVKGVSFKMIEVEGGTFTMGASGEQADDARFDETPARSVTLDSFMIGETEVTQALWTAVMGSNPSEHKGDNLPVENVSWKDCIAFLGKLQLLTQRNFRLPTEAEWEFAARGGNMSCGYKYAGSNDLSEVAWYDMNSGLCTHEVKTKSPNELGLYDMSGNVKEWCSDWYTNYEYVTTVNPKGPDVGNHRVNRGGCFNMMGRYCRVSTRFENTEECATGYIGLRLSL